VGCSVGNDCATLLAALGRPAKVTGVDLMEAQLATARDRVPGATFVQADAAKLPSVLHHCVEEAEAKQQVAINVWLEFLWSPLQQQTGGLYFLTLHQVAADPVFLHSLYFETSLMVLLREMAQLLC